MVLASLRLRLLVAVTASSAAAFSSLSRSSPTSSPVSTRTAAKLGHRDHSRRRTVAAATCMSSSSPSWSPDVPEHVRDARERLCIEPLDEYNAELLNEVHPMSYDNPKPLPLYDLVVIGAGAGGLVSSRQAARRGAKSAMISAHLAGGDCLNAGCVPSKALLRAARMVREVRRAAEKDNEFGITVESGSESAGVSVDFSRVMERMRRLRAKIAPIDGHARGTGLGVGTFQGFGRFVSPTTVEVVEKNVQNGGHPILLNFKKAVIATGGRPSVPTDIDGLKDAPFVTNESLFNLRTLPPRMVVLGSGVVALEMAQAFAAFGSKVTILQRSERLLPKADPDVGKTLEKALQEDGVSFVAGARVVGVETLREGGEATQLPLMKVSVTTADKAEPMGLECECLLIAVGRKPNVENMGLEAAKVEFDPAKGVLIDDLARSVTNPNVFAVGDCVAGVPRLTHVSGEMAKVVVQNALFEDSWKVSSLVIPACMYTEPEYATAGLTNPEGDVDVYAAELEHNDRAILEGDDDCGGFVKILCKRGTGQIVGCTIVAPRAGEMINEVTLAMKHGISLEGIGRNIHAYPTTGEAIMMCGLQLINSKWKRLD